MFLRSSLLHSGDGFLVTEDMGVAHFMAVCELCVLMKRKNNYRIAENLFIYSWFPFILKLIIRSSLFSLPGDFFLSENRSSSGGVKPVDPPFEHPKAATYIGTIRGRELFSDS